MSTAPAPPHPIVLVEYGEVEVQLSSAALQRLRDAAADRIRIAPGPGPDRWLLRATQHVGSLVTPDLQLLVRPKVPIANVLYLLEADGTALGLDRTTVGYAEDPELAPAVATLYARRLEEALATGIVRRYRTVEDRLVAPRGRIDIARQARTGRLPIPVAVRFDEYDVDTPLNRILRAAAHRLMGLVGVAAGTRRSLLRSIDRMEGVGPLQPSDLARPMVLTRLDEEFRASEALARLVLTSIGVRDRAGDVGANTFLIDMNRVVERFISQRFRQHLGDPFRVDLQRHARLDQDGHVVMQPDIVLRHGSDAVGVVDVKYKLTGDGFGRTSDYYQLLAYTTGLALSRGFLVYCQADGSVPPRSVRVRHTGVLLESRPLLLDGDVRGIERRVRELVTEVRDAMIESAPMRRVA